LALATGAGSESRIQIGLVVVGGMSLGTVLTLFVVPTFYTLLTRRHRDSGSRAEQAMAESHGDGASAPVRAATVDVPAPTPSAGS
jgi:multidrug efflux pump